MLVALSPTSTAASARSSGISHRVCTLAYTIVMTMIVYCSKCAIFWNSTHVVCRIHPTSRVGGKAQIKFNMLEPPPHVREQRDDLRFAEVPGKTQYHCVEGASVSRETRKSVVRQSTTMWRGPVSRVR